MLIRGIKRIIRWYVHLLEHFSAGTITALFAPGVIGLVGAKYLSRDIVGTMMRSRNFFLPLGEDFVLSPPPKNRLAELFALLFPPFLLLGIGTTLMIPLIYGEALLGESPIPGLGVRPLLLATDDGLVSLIVDTMSSAPDTALALWCGISCWYAGVPTYPAIRDARACLALPLDESPVWIGRLGTAVRTATWPIQGILRVLSRFDTAMTWLGGGAMVATRGFAVVTFLVVLRVASGWTV